MCPRSSVGGAIQMTLDSVTVTVILFTPEGWTSLHRSMNIISAGLMPTEARGNYLPEPPYLRETKTYHSQPLKSIRHAGNYFVPLSMRPIFSFCCRSYVKLLDYWRAEKNFSTSGGPLRPVAFATSATWLIRHWISCNSEYVYVGLCLINVALPSWRTS